MTVRRESAWDRVSREAYLALRRCSGRRACRTVSRKQGHPARKRSFRRALHASRDTSDEERSVGSPIVAEVSVQCADSQARTLLRLIKT